MLHRSPKNKYNDRNYREVRESEMGNVTVLLNECLVYPTLNNL